ncbi:MAG: bifunctional diaminohydroxyphosphoribosylaminopyrimidine deaminase/5-amino-6-(5-phosphoribosylamino)uracil reductase RibD [Methylococcaceae bacterium]|nr:MAG: bifunctional diaminohydroxyphosphoribosylaminopyrimidine deaminase/5-amino-6-(5-phosphoribosylamino)uracil reductase RibD [Methylococcaceae bacterium]
MAHALRLAERGLYTTDPNPRVGCIISRNGAVVGAGWHSRAGGPHAEVEALRQAGEAARGATVYVTLEPCSHHGRTPPCADALIQAGVARVVAAMQDPNPRVAGAGLARLQAAGIATACGLLEEQALRLNRGFVKRMQTGRPWVTGKLAMSLDGRTALSNGDSRWITGAEARRDAHRLRAQSSAIVTGIGTLLADDPAMTARLEDEEVLQPLRVVLDSRLRTPVTARLAHPPGHALIICGHEDAARRQALEQAGFSVLCLPLGDDGRLDLAAVLDALGRRDINEVMLEAGPTLNGAWLQAALVDEWVVYMAPCLLGDTARGLFSLPALGGMDERYHLRWLDVRQVGADLRLKFQF